MIKPIHSKKDYKEVLRRVEVLMDKRRNQKETDELEILCTLVEKYEEIHFPIDLPDPVDAIKFAMEQFAIDQVALGKILGGRNRASEVLHRKRTLSLPMIRKLHQSLNIPSECLIKEYSIVK